MNLQLPETATARGRLRGGTVGICGMRSCIEWALARLGAAIAVVVVSLGAAASDAHAQSLEPRTYANTPVGLNFLIGGYGYMHYLVDPSVALKDGDAKTHSALLAYIRSLDLWGKSGQIGVVLPYGWLSASGTIAATGERRTREVSGFGDPVLRVSVNLYGAPALSLEEYAHYQQDTIVGVSLLMTAPLGQYNPDKLANIGANRWSFKPEIGISKALGRLTLEAATGVTFFTKNDEFFGGTTREQDPIYSVQGHLIYNFRSGIWAALDTTFYTGGRTTIDDVKRDDLQRNLRLGVTVALPVNRRNSIKLYWSTGVYTRTGSEIDLAGVVWQYRWGGSL